LIGINNAILERAQGIGFAIPIKEVRQALGEIFNSETAGRWFGAQVSVDSPLMIQAIEPRSPAAEAGLKAGDLIQDLNGHPAGEYIDFMRALRGPGELKFNLTVLRDGEERPIHLRLLTFAELFRRRMGLDLQELTPELVQQLGLDNLSGMESGLLIASVEKGSAADQTGLREYYLIDGIENRRVRNFLDVQSALASLATGETAELSLLVPRTRGNLILGYRRGQAGIKLR